MREAKRWIAALFVMALLVTGSPVLAQSVLDAPAKYGLESEPAGITDHQLVLGAFGFQVFTKQLDDLVNLNVVGFRRWLPEGIGLDLCGGLLLHEPHGDADFQAGLAMYVGVPLAAKAYKHVTFYLEPKLDFGLWRPAEDSTPWRLDLGGYFGAEVTLRWLGIPRQAFLAEIGAGLTVVNNGDDNDVTLSTKPGGSFPWMFSNDIGVVYYF